MEKILAIDGNSILNRAYYAIPIPRNWVGTCTNGIMGFINILLKTVQEFAPTSIAVAFDVHAPTFRHQQFAEYKANRRPSPDELRQQFEPLKNLLATMGIQTLEKAGYEADDILGTIAKTCTQNGDECFVMTGDRDCLQLASQLVKIILVVTKTGNNTETIYDESTMLEHYGVTPQEFIEVKTLMGDSGDNIPGAANIGEKTALSLIQQYQTVANVYNHLDELKPQKRASLEAFRPQWEQIKSLVTINQNVPIKFEKTPFAYEQLQTDKVIKALLDLKLISLANRLKPNNEEQLSWEF